ncbi:hypothetical protein CBR_g51461 [Chara braunii]|uniref:CCHC-type domain-containing protein n=1 Tax=Chara braunii TaxID=69332 RepID=A0A388K6C0_CHABU|nr:hypothetical protein CBR_g51461 [Chara braunii]|eukprot:GBG65579.1 hypothetical protein CBR_g51461 [Chara braunii]
MAASVPSRTCYTCGSPHHYMRECPHRGFAPRPPATGANAIPTGPSTAVPPVLALPPPSYANPVPAPAPVYPSTSNYASNYQGQPRGGFWKTNQERLDKCYAKVIADEEQAAKKKEEDERKMKLKEEEDRKKEWKEEREKLEAEMAARIDKRMELVCGTKNRTDGAGCEKVNEELLQLRKENESLRKRLTGEGTSCSEDRISSLQREMADLKRQMVEKRCGDDEVFALKKEIEELRGTALVKINFEQEIAG